MRQVCGVKYVASLSDAQARKDKHANKVSRRTDVSFDIQVSGPFYCLSYFPSSRKPSTTPFVARMYGAYKCTSAVPVKAATMYSTHDAQASSHVGVWRSRFGPAVPATFLVRGASQDRSRPQDKFLESLYLVFIQSTVRPQLFLPRR